MTQMTHECFADEIAIDFPSVGNVVDRMRDAFLGERGDADVLRADVSLSQREALAGRVSSDTSTRPPSTFTTCICSVLTRKFRSLPQFGQVNVT